MPLLKTRVNIQNRFGEITAAVNRMAQEAVTEGADAGSRVASQVASQRSRTGDMAAIKVEPVRGSDTGWVASFSSPVYYAWFQDLGTLGSRRRALKRNASTKRTRAPGTGIKPLGFLEAGRRAGRQAMMARFKRGL